jgi:hypothetical protein
MKPPPPYFCDILFLWKIKLHDTLVKIALKDTAENDINQTGGVYVVANLKNK